MTGKTIMQQKNMKIDLTKITNMAETMKYTIKPKANKPKTQLSVTELWFDTQVYIKHYMFWSHICLTLR